MSENEYKIKIIILVVYMWKEFYLRIRGVRYN